MVAHAPMMADRTRKENEMKYQRGTKRQLLNLVMYMDINHNAYINSINLTEGAFKALRTMIKEGVLEPDVDMVRETYKDVDAVMSGDVIIPQMAYTKRKEF